ncbi:MAG: cyclic nucleotide-binding domain-containing protein [Hyphomicrobiaceae bacterium]|nr:cyclic nucleotide-binding domain-containing protein [Hyphomicrobiaceae bacterium]
MSPPFHRPVLTRTGVFADLTADEQSALEAELDPLPLRRGEVLVRQGEEADALYVVVSGRFVVTIAGRNRPVAEIGPGSPVGEIAFLAGGQRTATVTAVRDSLVVRLERADFDRLCQRTPKIWETLTVALARRLADQTAGRSSPAGQSAPRTIAVIRAGPEPIPASFIEDLARAFARAGRSIVVSSSTVAAVIGGSDLASGAATEALNALEGAHDTVLYVADPLLTHWSEKAMRQADLVLRVGFSPRHASGPVDENVLERFAASLVGPAQQRLVVLHPRRAAPRGTRHWIGSRNIAMHHHAAVGDAGDVARLVRFVKGEAIGLVACGGGAFCAAHVGLFKALLEAGAGVDIMGGTSGGSAMAAAFAMGLGATEIDDAIHDIFVKRRALRRYTWPRYSILDHTRFDRLLEHYYGGIDVEDLWVPFFAVSTNLSRYGTWCHRSGDLFSAVRASGSIPALLPPCYTADGQMLVDGALAENVPVATMRELKAGPNLVVAFEVPQLQRFDVDYRSLPSRGALLRRMLLPIGAKPLPDAPSLGSVLMRSLMANRQEFDRHLTVDDLLLVPPLPLDMTILDWGRHAALLESARVWATSEIARQRDAGHPAMLAACAAGGSSIVRARSAIEKM